MTATVALPAPPEPYLGTGLLPVTPGTAHRSGRRHRVVAIGSGFGGLTATKALKHDLVNIADVLAFVMRIAARGTAHVHAQASLWLHVIPTTAAVFTAVGVLITLYAAIIRERKSAERPHYEITTAAGYFSYDGRLRRPQRTSKGWH
jgi:predicted metal-binding membrane protein